MAEEKDISTKTAVTVADENNLDVCLIPDDDSGARIEIITLDEDLPAAEGGVG